MAVVISNPKTVNINNVSISEVTSIDVSLGATTAQHVVDGGISSSIATRGGGTISSTCNSTDPGLTAAGLFGAVLASSSGYTFVVNQGCAGSGTATITLADGSPEKAVAESWEFDSGSPGEVSSSTATFQIVGLLEGTPLADWKAAFSV